MKHLLFLFLPALALAQGLGTPTNEQYVDENGKKWLIYDKDGEQVIYFADATASSNDLAADSASGGGGYVSYGAIQRRPFCNQNIYGNCIQPYDGKPETCTYYTKCRRGGK